MAEASADAGETGTFLLPGKSGSPGSTGLLRLAQITAVTAKVPWCTQPPGRGGEPRLVREARSAQGTWQRAGLEFHNNLNGEHSDASTFHTGGH